VEKEKERPSFLKKRSKKLLFLKARAEDRSATAIKSFLVLFFKKEHLSFCSRRTANCPGGTHQPAQA
jgi:hypothetical protein